MILPDIGIDTGLTSLLTDSTGRSFDPPRAWYMYRTRLKKEQQKLSRQFEARKVKYEGLVIESRSMGLPIPHIKDIPYSKRLKDQIKAVAKIHTKIERIRDYHHKKNASIIANTANRVAVEDHALDFMIHNKRLSKIVSDRAIGKQKLLLRSKLGPRYFEVPNYRPGIGGNSQTCTCGASVPKELKDRVHRCLECGLVADRDHVSANIVSIIAFGHSDISLSSSHKKYQSK